MFTRAEPGSLTIHVNGVPVRAAPGDSVAAALLAHGQRITRHSVVSGAPRGPYCMMGACFDCLAVVDGRPSVQTCLTPVRNGMRVELQDGPRTLQPRPAEP